MSNASRARAAAQKAARKSAKTNGRHAGSIAPAPSDPSGGPTVKLDNPVREHFATFVIANALKWEAMVHDELIRVAPAEAEKLEPFEGILGFLGRDGRPAAAHAAAYEKWCDFRDAVAAHCPERFVAVQGSAEGQHIVICGAGPTLREHMHEWCPQGDQVWGVNSALPYLVKEGFRVTHGLTVDQTPAMCEEWFSAPDVEYLLATTCHPHLTGYLMGRNRKLRFFNNFVGIKGEGVTAVGVDGVTRELTYEDWLYSVLFHGTVRCGSGLNSVTRAIDLALFMGAAKITVLGADCALRVRAPLGAEVVQGSPEHLAWLHTAEMHADGGHALASGATPLTFGGVIDGRHWETKPDMVISAVWLNKMRQLLQGRLVLIGDTLPNALGAAKSFRNAKGELETVADGSAEAFLARLPSLVDSSGQPVPVADDFGPAPATESHS